MKQKLKIIIACGSGVATSTLAAKTVQDVCYENDFNASIETCSIREINNYSESADIILTTSRYDKTLSCPVMSVTAFITGIGVEKTKKELAERLRKILDEK